MARRQVYVVAEMACSHEGESELARTIIDGAGKAGADGIQLQIWTADGMVVPGHPDFETMKRIELPRDTWRQLAKFSRQRHPKMELIACVYERASVDFCEEIRVDAYKLHTADLSNPQLIRHVARTGRRVDLSVGASTVGEIERAVHWIREESDAPIWLMYGIQNFPTPPEAIHLSHMAKLKELFELPVGYQDHCAGNSPAGFWLPAAAVGLGVDVLEKHITHDRSKRGIDHQAALNPGEFEDFVGMVRKVESALGTGTPRPFTEAELTYRKYSKKSIVASRDLPAGTRLTEGDLEFLRTGEMGLAPEHGPTVWGRTLKRALPSYAPIKYEDLE